MSLADNVRVFGAALASVSTDALLRLREAFLSVLLHSVRLECTRVDFVGYVRLAIASNARERLVRVDDSEATETILCANESADFNACWFLSGPISFALTNTLLLSPPVVCKGT